MVHEKNTATIFHFNSTFFIYLARGDLHLRLSWSRLPHTPHFLFGLGFAISKPDCFLFDFGRPFVVVLGGSSINSVFEDGAASGCGGWMTKAWLFLLACIVTRTLSCCVAGLPCRCTLVALSCCVAGFSCRCTLVALFCCVAGFSGCLASWAFWWCSKTSYELSCLAVYVSSSH